jgi:hypothetical protein
MTHTIAQQSTQTTLPAVPLSSVLKTLSTLAPHNQVQALLEWVRADAPLMLQASAAKINDSYTSVVVETTDLSECEAGIQDVRNTIKYLTTAINEIEDAIFF